MFRTRPFFRQALSLIVLLLLAFDLSAQEGYKLNPGDQLEISVWREESLQREVLVLPDGTISFPLVGIITASGRTASDLRSVITTRLKSFVPEAEVTVSVIQATGNQIYVLGKVINPGAYALSGPTDVMQALSLAGGLDRFANEKKIRVLRRVKGVQKAIPFNYDAVLEGESLKSNIILQSRDTIIVP